MEVWTLGFLLEKWKDLIIKFILESWANYSLTRFALGEGQTRQTACRLAESQGVGSQLPLTETCLNKSSPGQCGDGVKCLNYPLDFMPSKQALKAKQQRSSIGNRPLTMAACAWSVFPSTASRELSAQPRETNRHMSRMWPTQRSNCMFSSHLFYPAPVTMPGAQEALREHLLSD